MNLETECALKKNLKIADYALDIDENQPKIFYELNEFDIRKVYRLNILVHDIFGLGRVYRPVWIINGYVYENYFESGMIISLGFILLAAIFIIVISYLFFGFIINIIRKQKGLHLIPNYDIWVELFLLCIDGIKLLICFDLFVKKKNLKNVSDSINQYSDLDNEKENKIETINEADKEKEDIKIEENNNKIESNEKNSKIESNYGAI